jgi:hypothetical protein
MTLGAEGGIKDSLGFRCECVQDVIEVLHGVSLRVRLSHSLRALLAGPDQHRAQPCQGWPSSAIHRRPLTRRARC